MNGYKKIIRNQETRYRILRYLSFIPDNLMLRLQYRIKMGRKLNLEDPRRYSEKLQWYKLNYRNPLMQQCSDKASVREYVESKGLGGILNQCYGVYEKVEDICWDDLPDSFVIKDTLGGGGRSMIFVNEKSKLNKDAACTTMQRWLDTPVNEKSLGREWVYEGKKHRIIIEKLIVAKEDGDLPDIKFFCFNGKVYCSYLMQHYTLHHELGELAFIDRDFKQILAYRRDFKPLSQLPQKFDNYEKMIEIAEKLSGEFPHVRVDLYNVKGQIIFGELTFFNASGYTQFTPDEFDFTLGEKFILPNRK